MHTMAPPSPSGEQTLRPDTFIVSKTDLQGTITYVNPYFIQISGYSEAELVGQPHNIIRHPDMPKLVFKMLWDRIKEGEEFWGYVKNRTKQGGFYWVFAHVTPSYDVQTRKKIGYHSDRRAPEMEKLAKIIPFYQKLKSIENQQGINAAEDYLNQYLKEQEMAYDDFIFSL